MLYMQPFQKTLGMFWPQNFVAQTPPPRASKSVASFGALLGRLELNFGSNRKPSWLFVAPLGLLADSRLGFLHWESTGRVKKPS